MTRKKGGKLARIENCVDTAIQGLEKYITKNKKRLITVASDIRESTIRKSRKQKREEKQLFKCSKDKTWL